MSSVDTLENTPEQEVTGHEGHAHDHEHHDHDHDHAHNPAPVLNPDCTRDVELEIPAEDVTKAFRGVTRNYQKYARIPGFRPGKAPESVIKRKYANEIRKDVLDQLLPEKFNKAVADLGVAPVGQPQVTELKIEDGEPLHVKAVFEYLPEFSIEGYQNVTVPKPSVEATDDEFNAEIEQLRDSRSTVEPVEEERPLVDGDWALISYAGKIEGSEDTAPIKGEEALVEIGGKDTVEAFTSALRGATVGQTLDVSASYPAEYPQATLAGKTVDYTIDVKGIRKRIVPELNDEFAKELGNYENLADLETKVREHVASRKRRSVEGETKDQLFHALVDRFPFPVPETLVQEQIDARLERGLRALAQQGMNAEQMRKLDFARLRAAQRDSAAAEVKSGILLAKISQAENVQVTDEEVNHEVQIGAMQTGESADALLARLTQDGGLARIREQLKREKTAQLLYDRLPA
ncbi:trigger factor [Terracidiphilus gabretensis]|uniref:trigger factor n=1 Tax=Terracidiphilus gabretensis TaxID=1577687 RepID=UPI00071B078E|nr:trigger factor [Terracidiphilus gabretensis]